MRTLDREITSLAAILANPQPGKLIAIDEAEASLHPSMLLVEVKVPALRERREDILSLARHFLAFFARATGRAVPELSPAAERALEDYAWPGNVRELRNTIDRAMILWPSPRLEPQAFPERIAGAKERGPFVGGDYTFESIERAHILSVMARASSLDSAAAVLGIDSSTLWRKRKKYDEAG